MILPPYTIKQFSELTGITPTTLRYYEKEQLLTDVERNELGYRLYDQDHLDYVTFIQKMKQAEMPLKEIRQYAEMRLHGKETVIKRMTLLFEHKQRVLQKMKSLEEAIDLIDAKLENYHDGTFV